jgi:hypothetical protein
MLRLVLTVLLISFSTMSFADTLKTQRYLNALGYNAGAADGIWGGKTENAIQKFLSDTGKSWDGKFDDEFKFLENAYFGKFPPINVPKLVFERADMPPRFKPNHRIDRGTFTNSFDIVNDHKKGSYGLAIDPSGKSTNFVETFYIDGTKCLGSDCKFGSVRSQLSQDFGDEKYRPAKSWYSFEVFLPSDYPIKSKHKGRYHTLVEFKENMGCATTMFGMWPGYNDTEFMISHYYIEPENVRFMMNNNAPDDMCKMRFQKKVGNPRKMRGRWTRFEYYIYWTVEDDGKFIIYNNGRKMMDYTGPTCSSKKLCLGKNNHYYGLYSPNNKNRGCLKSVEPATIYYRNVGRADTRDQLVRSK